MPTRPTLQQYTACLEQEFTIESPAQTLPALQLIKVDAIRSSNPDDPEQSAFSLLFRGPPQPLLSQQIYWLHHPGLGEQAIFLVPIGPDDDGMCYEAVFN